MRKIESILVDQYDLQIISKQSGDTLNGLYIIGRNDQLDVIIGAPGRIKDEKWVIRLVPHILFGGVFFDFEAYLENEFESKDEVIVHLTNKQAHVYNDLFKYVIDEYRKNISIDTLIKHDQ